MESKFDIIPSTTKDLNLSLSDPESYEEPENSDSSLS
jgi:hypothetical protein